LFSSRYLFANLFAKHSEVIVTEAIHSPTADRRWKLIKATIRRHGHQSNALIETLHAVQESFGYLETPALREVARALSVATFYHLFTLKPAGQHTCVVCTGTACHIRGASNILSLLQQDVKLGPGQTSKGNEVSLLTARCLGLCGLAPAAVFDGEVIGKLTPEAVSARVRGGLVMTLDDLERVGSETKAEAAHFDHGLRVCFQQCSQKFTGFFSFGNLTVTPMNQARVRRSNPCLVGFDTRWVKGTPKQSEREKKREHFKPTKYIRHNHGSF
jgi:bidirectional [NiFe] hydrogenase diaphorase subunit